VSTRDFAGKRKKRYLQLKSNFIERGINMEDLQKRVDDYLCANQQKWTKMGRDLLDIPEIGFCEEKTSKYVTEKLESLGITPIEHLAVTGCIAKLSGRTHKANVAIMGELDAIYCPNHPHANPQTGLAHACGHNVQVTALLAVAEALQQTGVMKELDGDVSLIAVPAEEMVPEAILAKLSQEGKINADCGKKELLQLGALNDVDVVLGTHALVNDELHPDQIMINSSCNGLVVLKYTFQGKTAHSTVCPEKGINALNAAVLAINGIQSLRESFAPEEYIRVSYNLTEGGISIGNVPDVAKLEVVVATKSMGVMEELQQKVTVAAECGAKVLGCTLKAETEIGYLPYEVDKELLKIIGENGGKLLGKVPRTREHNYFSNDLGDVSQRIPTAQIVFGGFKGALHTEQFHATDEENAYLLPARTVAATIIDLLQNNAKKALAVKEHFQDTHKK
jgi:amidohydrolase